MEDVEAWLARFKFQGDWCHAGGVTNFAKVGHITDDPNYGWPHVVLAGTTNCCCCGREIDV